MAVLPESGGPTNSSALPLDFVLPRTRVMTRSWHQPRKESKCACRNGPTKRNRAIARESNARLPVERLPTSGKTSGAVTSEDWSSMCDTRLPSVVVVIGFEQSDSFHVMFGLVVSTRRGRRSIDHFRQEKDNQDSLSERHVHKFTP